MHIFDNDNFSIIPKSIFFDNDNLPISCKNADISAIDNFFDDIAHPYSHEGHLASAVALLQAGADPLLPQVDGQLPIHAAANNNHPEVVRILIEQGGCSIDQVRDTVVRN